MTETPILHADADSFFASVEQRDDPELRGQPVIVGPGVVMAASYEAKAFGIRSGMGGKRARRLCPDAVFVPPRFSAYVEASKALFEVFRDTAPTVEGLSLEEAFLDVGGLERISGTPLEIARRLRRECRERVGLPVSVGVARTKVLAKMASRAAKPDGLLLVPPEGELGFLLPLPVDRVWGVGDATAARLHAHGIRTIADAARLEREQLVAILGRAGGHALFAIARNDDARRVRGDRRRSSFGAQSALGRRRRAPEEVEARLAGLVDRVTRRMRRARRVGRTVTLRLRFGDFSRATRSRTMAQPSAATRTILRVAHGLLAEAAPAIERRGLTLVGIAVSNLRDRDPEQLPLPLDRGGALDAALDELRERFGASVVKRASLVGGDGIDGGVLADAARSRRSEGDPGLSPEARGPSSAR